MESQELVIVEQNCFKHGTRFNSYSEFETTWNKMTEQTLQTFSVVNSANNKVDDKKRFSKQFVHFRCIRFKNLETLKSKGT